MSLRIRRNNFSVNSEIYVKAFVTRIQNNRHYASVGVFKRNCVKLACEFTARYSYRAFFYKGAHMLYVVIRIMYHIMAKKRLFNNALKNDWISTATVDSQPVNEKFNGFGVAITGSSCYELSTMSPEHRDAFLEDIYGRDGLNLSVARLSMGSSDYSPFMYSYCDTPGDTELKTFSVDMEKEYIIPMIKEALKHNPYLEFLASPWSPPGWMKTGGLLSCGYMRDKYIDCYADYFVKYISSYGAEGINISAVTPPPKKTNRNLIKKELPLPASGRPIPKLNLSLSCEKQWIKTE